VKLGRPWTVPHQIVHRICALRAGGATWRAIAQELNQDQVPTGQGGKQWYPGTVRLVALGAATVAA
jgi:hypothetical protein